MEQFDAIVIGAGQGGGPLAGALSDEGNKRVAIIERSFVGGTCINTGCTPTKTMVGSAGVAYLARRGAEFGVNTGDISVDMKKIAARTRGVVEQFRSGSEKALTSKKNVTLIYGSAKFAGPRVVRVGERELTAPWVFINTGTDTMVPDFDGIHDVPYLTNATIEKLEELPEHLLILGGSYIACEFGQMFRRFGSKVTIFERGPQLMGREDKDVSDCLRQIFDADGIAMHCNTKVTAVKPRDGGVELTADGTSHRGSHLLIAAGRSPNTGDLGLDTAGVEIDSHGYIKVNKKLETAAEGVYALGDVKGGPAFTHISYDDFRILRDNLLRGGDRNTGDRMVPYTVFTDPQIGRIGMSEAEARKSGKRIATATMPASSIARATEIGQPRGMMKIIVDRDTDTILGATMMNSDGGEMAAVVELAMMGGITCRQIQDAVFAHPTWAESLNNLVGKLKDVD